MKTGRFYRWKPWPNWKLEDNTKDVSALFRDVAYINQEWEPVCIHMRNKQLYVISQLAAKRRLYPAFVVADLVDLALSMLQGRKKTR